MNSKTTTTPVRLTDEEIDEALDAGTLELVEKFDLGEAPYPPRHRLAPPADAAVCIYRAGPEFVSTWGSDLGGGDPFYREESLEDAIEQVKDLFTALGEYGPEGLGRIVHTAQVIDDLTTGGSLDDVEDEFRQVCLNPDDDAAAAADGLTERLEWLVQNWVSLSYLTDYQDLGDPEALCQRIVSASYAGLVVDYPARRVIAAAADAIGLPATVAALAEDD